MVNFDRLLRYTTTYECGFIWLPSWLITSHTNIVFEYCVHSVGASSTSMVSMSSRLMSVAVAATVVA